MRVVHPRQLILPEGKGNNCFIMPMILLLYSCYYFFAICRQTPQHFNTGRSKAVLLLWFLTVTCSCCPYLYFGLPIK